MFSKLQKALLARDEERFNNDIGNTGLPNRRPFHTAFLKRFNLMTRSYELHPAVSPTDMGIPTDAVIRLNEPGLVEQAEGKKKRGKKNVAD